MSKKSLDQNQLLVEKETEFINQINKLDPERIGSGLIYTFDVDRIVDEVAGDWHFNALIACLDSAEHWGGELYKLTRKFFLDNQELYINTAPGEAQDFLTDNWEMLLDGAMKDSVPAVPALIHSRRVDLVETQLEDLKASDHSLECSREISYVENLISENRDSISQALQTNKDDFLLREKFTNQGPVLAIVLHTLENNLTQTLKVNDLLESEYYPILPESKSKPLAFPVDNSRLMLYLETSNDWFVETNVPIPVLFGKYIYQGPILFGAFMQHELEKATQNGQLARGVAHEILHEIAGSGRFTFDDEELPEEDDQAISILVEAAHDLWTRGILDQANSPGGLQGCYIDSISDRGWEYVFAAVAEANNKNQLQLAEKLARAGSMPRSFQVLQAEINCSIEDIYQIADLCKTVEQMNGQVDIKALRQSVKQYFAAGV